MREKISLDTLLLTTTKLAGYQRDNPTPPPAPHPEKRTTHDTKNNNLETLNYET